MELGRRRTQVAVLLVGLPLLSNVASLVIFAPLFTPNRTATSADFQRAGLSVGIAIGALEVVALLLIVAFLRGENTSLKSVVNFQRDRLRAYLSAGLIALLPTLLAGWLYGQAQAQAGIESNVSQLGWSVIGLWYVLIPISAAFLEETIWRGYSIPRLQGTWRSLLFMGTDIAKETADITLARHDLGGLAEAIALSRATLKKIRQNLFFAFVYNVLGIPLAALGLLSPVFAGAAMAMSSVSVVTNALLLRKLKLRDAA